MPIAKDVFDREVTIDGVRWRVEAWYDKHGNQRCLIHREAANARGVIGWQYVPLPPAESVPQEVKRLYAAGLKAADEAFTRRFNRVFIDMTTWIGLILLAGISIGAYGLALIVYQLSRIANALSLPDKTPPLDNFLKAWSDHMGKHPR